MEDQLYAYHAEMCKVFSHPKRLELINLLRDKVNDDDRLRRDVINALMCHGRIDFANIEARHDIVFRDYFAEALAQLEEMQADGLLTIGADAIEVLPAGRLMMRNMAMAFDAYLKPNEGRFSRTV